MKKGAAARELVGFLAQHAAAFKDVARRNNCIIMCRAPGVFVPGLVSEGYASKGFHNKAKSCNWGPMAGFVNMYARFSKAGLTEEGYKKQTEAVRSAFMEGASPIHLHISENRINWLKRLGYIKDYKLQKLPKGKRGSRVWQFQATMKDCKGTYVGDAKKYIFTLKERSIGDEFVWAVYYQEKSSKDMKPVKALMDPNWKDLSVELTQSGVFRQQGSLMPLHRKATTGDYDLFAVWGPTGLNPSLYQRDVGSKDLNSKSDLGLKMDPDRGNSSQFIEQVRVALNAAIRRVRWGSARFAYSGGEMVHHGDEAGRPFMDDVDLPFIAFFPPGLVDLPGFQGADTIAFESIEEFRKLIEKAAKWGYNIELNPGWVNELSGGKSSLKRFYNQFVIQGKQYEGIL